VKKKQAVTNRLTHINKRGPKEFQEFNTTDIKINLKKTFLMKETTTKAASCSSATSIYSYLSSSSTSSIPS
jgi:hypothetical protein